MKQMAITYVIEVHDHVTREDILNAAVEVTDALLEALAAARIEVSVVDGSIPEKRPARFLQ